MRRLRDPRTALRRDLAAVAARLGRDELRVLVLLATRAWAGRARYGCLAARRDPRDFRAERPEEPADAWLYVDTALLRVARKRPRRGLRRHV